MIADESPGEYGAADVHLRRTIGLTGLIGLATSVQIGSGWLLTCLISVTHAGPAAVLSWLVGAAFFTVIGVAWMELGTAVPRAGGGVRYPRMSHGAFVSWINAWGAVVAIIAVPVVETMAILTYAGGKWPGLGVLHQSGEIKVLAWPQGILSGCAIMLVFLGLNLFGSKLLSESNKWVTVWKLLIPTVTFAMMFTAFKAENFTHFGGFTPMGVGGIFGAISGGGIIFAYCGVRQIIDFSGEAINPKRNIPIALLVGGILIPAVLYTCLQVGFIGALDWRSAGVGPGDWSGLLNSNWQASPLIDAVTAAGFAWFSYVLISDAALSPAATGWVMLGLAGRTTYAMSINGEVPAGFQRINRWGVPWVALVTCTVVGFLLFLPLPSWYVFIGMVGTAITLSYLFAGPCVAVFRRVAPDLPRAINIPFLRFWLLTGFLCSTLLIYFAGWNTLVNVTTILFAGLPVYAARSSVRNGWSSRNVSGAFALAWAVAWVVVAVSAGWMFQVGTDGEHWPIGLYAGAFVGLIVLFLLVLWAISDHEGRRQIKAGLWVFPVLVPLPFIAYFGDEGPRPTLQYGSDVLLVAALSAACYTLAVRSGYRTDELDQVVRQQIDMERHEKHTASAG
ncbi:APC family permease [Streptomyces sp. NPDC016845]|uniref:APC family permease n=1 Tax=Streptomyces sp. NPDC016845 TaxID=3364972 RepID=UPI00379794E2